MRPLTVSPGGIQLQHGDLDALFGSVGDKLRGTRCGRATRFPLWYRALESSYSFATLAKNSSGVCVAGTDSVSGWPKAIHPLPIDSIICS